MVRMEKKITGVLVVIFLLVSMFIFSAIAAPEKIIVGTSADWPPFEWVDANNNFVGFDMDLMKILASIQGYEVEINDIGFDSLIPAIQSGKIDLIAAGATLTEERLEVLDASTPYWEVNQGVLVREDSELNIVTALTGGSIIGAQRGTTQADWLESNLVEKGIDVKIELYETNDLGIMDLVNQRIDAFVADTPAVGAFAAMNPVKAVGTFNTEDQLVYYVQKGDPKGILPLINEGLTKVQMTPIWNNLVNAYFAGDLSKISDCYTQHGSLLEEDLEAYARNLAQCMTAD